MLRAEAITLMEQYYYMERIVKSRISIYTQKQGLSQACVIALWQRLFAKWERHFQFSNNALQYHNSVCPWPLNWAPICAVQLLHRAVNWTVARVLANRHWRVSFCSFSAVNSCVLDSSFDTYLYLVVYPWSLANQKVVRVSRNLHIIFVWWSVLLDARIQIYELMFFDWILLPIGAFWAALVIDSCWSREFSASID